MLSVSIAHGLSEISVTDSISVGWTGAPHTPDIITMDEFRMAQSSPHGGMIRNEYGNMVLLPGLFSRIGANDATWWPPPRLLSQVVVGWYPDDGGSYWSLASPFVAWLESWSAEGVVYSLRARDVIDATVKDKHYTGTLWDVFVEACAALGLSIDGTWTRSPSPPVDWVASGENLVLDNLDALAKFFTHSFFIEGAVLYLIDTIITGAVDTDVLTSRDIESVEYYQNGPVRRYTANYQPTNVKRLKFEFLVNQHFATDAVAVREIKVARGVDASLVLPDWSFVSSYIAPNGPERLIDGDADTFWFATTLPESAEVAATVGPVLEYEITTEPGLEYKPKTWNLWAWNENTSEYEFVHQVDVPEWSTFEPRRFSVPGLTWLVRHEVAYDTSYRLGDPVHIAPTGLPGWGDIAAFLANIHMDAGRKRCRISLPIRGIRPRQKIEMTDTTSVPGRTITSWLNVDALTYNFTAGRVVVDGGGSWA